jgi:ClpP class serine protease
MRRSLQEARKKNVKAIVLRIDSPGGSALTSDLIWRNRIDQKNKTNCRFWVTTQPLVAITSLVMPIQFCRNTITGSIGVLEYYQILHR